jgi:glutamate synthase domain-containing protein 3
MTSGFVVILGAVGENFASGMSGGVVFVALETPFTPDGHGLLLGPTNCAPQPADAADPDVAQLRELLERHAEATGSPRAARLLAEWPQSLARFAKLAPAAPVPPEPVAEPEETDRTPTLVPSP